MRMRMPVCFECTDKCHKTCGRKFNIFGDKYVIQEIIVSDDYVDIIFFDELYKLRIEKDPSVRITEEDDGYFSYDDEKFNLDKYVGLKFKKLINKGHSTERFGRGLKIVTKEIEISTNKASLIIKYIVESLHCADKMYFNPCYLIPLIN